MEYKKNTIGLLGTEGFADFLVQAFSGRVVDAKKVSTVPLNGSLMDRYSVCADGKHVGEYIVVTSYQEMNGAIHPGISEIIYQGVLPGHGDPKLGDYAVLRYGQDRIRNKITECGVTVEIIKMPTIGRDDSHPDIPFP